MSECRSSSKLKLRAGGGKNPPLKIPCLSRKCQKYRWRAGESDELAKKVCYIARHRYVFNISTGTNKKFIFLPQLKVYFIRAVPSKRFLLRSAFERTRKLEDFRRAEYEKDQEKLRFDLLVPAWYCNKLYKFQIIGKNDNLKSKNDKYQFRMKKSANNWRKKLRRKDVFDIETSSENLGMAVTIDFYDRILQRF
jgi:hypothetical protein